MCKLDRKALYTLLTRIPRGRVTTYGALAGMLGSSTLSRAVGRALHANPDGDRYPCYRVVNCRGELSRAYAFGGMAAQQRRLEADGIVVTDGKVDLERYGCMYEPEDSAGKAGEKP